MERCAEASKRFDGTGNNLSSPRWRVTLMFVKFPQGGSNPRSFVRVFGIGGNKVPDSGVKYEFG